MFAIHRFKTKTECLGWVLGLALGTGSGAGSGRSSADLMSVMDVYGVGGGAWEWGRDINFISHVLTAVSANNTNPSPPARLGQQKAKTKTPLRNHQISTE